MRRMIPAPVIAVVAEIVSRRETHPKMDNLFMYAGVPGDPPEGNKLTKAQEWLRRANTEESVQPLQVLGRVLENYLEGPMPEATRFDTTSPIQHPLDQKKITDVLAQYELQYVRGGVLVGSLGIPSRTLEEFVRANDVAALEHEFNRALENVDSDPREAVSAASNILETLCKVYIEEQGLDMPAKQDLKPVWTVVRKDLGFDPSLVADQDLQTILTGLLAVVDGIGALRTHASSAHGAGKNGYKLEPRHSRLAVHSAHTLALFILESWERKKTKRGS